jgi:hypothetical protein
MSADALIEGEFVPKSRHCDCDLGICRRLRIAVAMPRLSGPTREITPQKRWIGAHLPSTANGRTLPQ